MAWSLRCCATWCWTLFFGLSFTLSLCLLVTFQGRRMFWRTSSVVPTRSLRWNSLSCQGCSRRSVGSSGFPISTSSPLGQMPSFLYTSCRFQMHFNTLGSPISGLEVFHRLLFFGKYCREWFSKGLSLILVARCGCRKSGSPIFCPCWSMNQSSFRK